VFFTIAQYTPRPVKEFTTVRPADAPLTNAEKDPNLFGGIPVPPEWRVEVDPENNGRHEHTHSPNTVTMPAATVTAVNTNGNGSAVITGVSTQTVEAVVVELSNGTKLLRVKTFRMIAR
jgi:hypothetical protein